MFWILCAAMVAVLAAGRAFQILGERRDRVRFPPPGRLVEVHGSRLHLLCTGSGGGPAIVVEQGAGGVAQAWRKVQDKLAVSATVLTYDRRGLGWSDPAALEGRSVDDRVRDLKALLEASRIKGPYVLVAHSYGGLIVRKFAIAYPELTAGLVLVDTLEEDVYAQPDVQKLYRWVCRILRVMSLVHYLGLPRLWQALFAGQKEADTPASAAMRALYMVPRAYSGMRADIASLQRLTQQERLGWPAGALGDLPLAVINHGQPFPGPMALLEKYWTAGQHRLAALSTRSMFVTASSSNHMIQDDDPDLTADTILRIQALAASEQPSIQVSKTSNCSVTSTRLAR